MGIGNYVRLSGTYVGIQAIGMAVMYHVFGAVYGEKEMIPHVLVAEVVLAGLIVGFVVRRASWSQAGFGAISWKDTLWALPVLVVLTLGAVNAVASAGAAGAGPLALLAATTLLVGFNEETMFRGIVLRGAMLRHGVIVALLISATAFMALHIVNVLGGEPVSEMLSGLPSHLLYGLFLGPLALLMRNLVPLILLHALWDFTVLAGAVTEVDDQGLLASAALLAVPVQFAITVLVWIVVLVRRDGLRG